jgi:phage terminase small subunit
MTIRQEQFCEFVVSGLSGTEAWIKSHVGCSRASARANAAESLAKPHIAAHIAVLRKPQTKKAVLSKERKREILHVLAENERAGPLTRIRAIEVDAKLAGHFEPEQVVVETGPNTLTSLQDRVKEVRSGLNLAHVQVGQRN